MSPMLLDELLNIDKVAVLELDHVVSPLQSESPLEHRLASLTWLSRYLAAERKFSKITVFEQRATVGGVWNHTPLNVIEETFTIPRMQPSKSPDTALWTPSCSNPQFVSPVYDLLETNVPHHLMNYSDQCFPKSSSLFPKHAVVKNYLQQYAESLKSMLSLGTQVHKVSRCVDLDGRRRWQLEALDLKTRVRRTEVYDAVLVANGHYNDPFIPNIKGLEDFNRVHPGTVSHSKLYRRPDQYTGKVRR